MTSLTTDSASSRSIPHLAGRTRLLVALVNGRPRRRLSPSPAILVAGPCTRRLHLWPTPCMQQLQPAVAAPVATAAARRPARRCRLGPIQTVQVLSSSSMRNDSPSEASSPIGNDSSSEASLPSRMEAQQKSGGPGCT